MTYEEMQAQYNEEVTTIETDLSGVSGLKGLYFDGCIAIDQNISTSVEKSCIYAEELGHHYTSVGNILEQTSVENRKQELKARIWGYNLRIGLNGIINAYKHGCRNRYEIAEYLDVTEKYLTEALSAYASIYGLYTQFDNYIVYFNNGGVAVFEWME